MGQPIFGHLTPEGYSEMSGEWLSSGNLLTRFNFANAIVTNKIKGTSINIKNILNDADANKPDKVQARLTQLILANELTNPTKKELEKITVEAAKNLNANNQMAVSMPNNQQNLANNKKFPPDYVTELMTLALGAPEFQRK